MEVQVAQYNAILKKTFGYDSLKKEQLDIIDNVVNKKKDVLAVLATGFGKSMCFQMPFLITQKCVIVISPLIALMADQKAELEKLNIPVCVLNSDNKYKTKEKFDILKGKYKIIYITPEYLENCEDFLQELDEQDGISLFCIDEAHTLSSWGSDFRKSYAKLGVLKELCPSVPVLAVTATASIKVRNDIQLSLGLQDPHIVIGLFDRPNLYIGVKQRTGNINEDIEDILLKYKNDYSIIYCKTKAEADNVAEKINAMGIKCGAYHAGLSPNTRADIQAKFIKGEIKCMVATIAFGMGINIPNVRVVFHYSCPKNLESYYQEIGRAGRDGKFSECIMYYGGNDFFVSNMLIEKLANGEYKTYQENEMKKIKQYVTTSDCRRILLLKSFDENTKITKCDNCDNCKRKLEDKQDFTYPAYLILMLLEDLNGKFGSGTLIDILKGSSAKKITSYHKQLDSYGAGKDKDADWWKAFIRMLIGNDFAKEKSISGGFGSTIEYTKKGNDWLLGIVKKYPLITKDTVVADKDKLMLHGFEGSDSDKQKQKPKIVVVGSSQAGKKWSSDELALLLENVKTKSITDTATAHNRTAGAIRSRLKLIAVDLHKKKKSVQDIMKITKLTEKAINEAINEN
jgi:Werner syndrome ATP-dependent helicase